MQTKVKFTDQRKWGRLSFLDILEINNIAFEYNGTELSFSNPEAHRRARGLWYNLVGTNEIGAL